MKERGNYLVENIKFLEVRINCFPRKIFPKPSHFNSLYVFFTK